MSQKEILRLKGLIREAKERLPRGGETLLEQIRQLQKDLAAAEANQWFIDADRAQAAQEKKAPKLE